jgi:hypothetical protein
VTAQGDRFKSPGQLEVEILVLRHQLNIQSVIGSAIWLIQQTARRLLR